MPTLILPAVRRSCRLDVGLKPRHLTGGRRFRSAEFGLSKRGGWNPQEDEAASDPIVGRAARTLDDMEKNPRGDWTFGDIERVCRQLGINFTSPTRGSHYKVSSDHLDGALTVPAHRPVKAVYILQGSRELMQRLPRE